MVEAEAAEAEVELMNVMLCNDGQSGREERNKRSRPKIEHHS